LNAPASYADVEVRLWSPTLVQLALAQLAPAFVEEGAAAEAVWLSDLRVQCTASDLATGLQAWEAAPPDADRTLHSLVNAMGLLPVERIAVALALAVDTDPIAARAVAWLQAPLPDMHPTVGLVAALHAATDPSGAQGLAALVDGRAVRSGLLQLSTQGRTLPDAVLSVPMAVVLAANGAVGGWPGVSLHDVRAEPLPPSMRAEAEQCAATLLAQMPSLVVRGAHPNEARAAAMAIAQCLGKHVAFIEGVVPPPGLVAWLLLHDALPVFCAELSPGERQRLPRLDAYAGPLLVASGLDGAWSFDGEASPVWRVPLPTAEERGTLWSAGGVAPTLAAELGTLHRHGMQRIAQLCRAAELLRLKRGDTTMGREHIHQAARHARSELGTLAESLPDDVTDAAMVLPPVLRDELERVLKRCCLRDGLANGLGIASRTRYRSGVRALLVGPSGTGKTLAAGWIATRLSLPLYRVDLAAINSKYIGETEKNLAELFARAEHAEVVLLFDEADALFGKRTEVKDSNDRFANQQTNYLLQRIESYDGIVLLTSNSRSRFDSAFTRRLDAIVEFPSPGPDERRALWLAHLGDAHTLSAAELNCLAAGCDLAGGHIRNVVLAARAGSDGGPIRGAELGVALAAEYRKLGKAVPAGLIAGPG